MTREALKQRIVEAVQREHGYSQPSIGDTVLAAIQQHRRPRLDRRVTLYVAGPMTGYPDLNFPAFHSEAARLRKLGYEVVNPAEINADPSMGWQECMRNDIAELVFCDGVVLLPGWEHSRGAQLECEIAKRLGLFVRESRQVIS